MAKKGCSSCVWLTRSAPPQSSPRYQAKKPAHIDTVPTYAKPAQALGRMSPALAGHSHSAMGSVMGSAPRQTQQITRSAPSAGVTLAPYT